MDWLHCNSCYGQPGEAGKKKFVVTNCGHLYCATCHSEKIKVCIICHREFSAIPIEAGMNKEMELYFLDPSIRKQVEVFEFQHSHRMRLVKFLRDKANRYDALKDECKRHRDEKNSLKDELVAKCNENRQLKNDLAICRNQLSNFSSHGSDQKFNAPSSDVFFKKSDRTFGSQSQIFNTTTQINFANAMEGRSGSPFGGKENSFASPPPVSFQNAYRNCNTMTSPRSSGTPPGCTSPRSSESLRSIGSVQRKVVLPGDRGSSPVNRIGLHQMNLKTPITRIGASPIVKIHNRVTRPPASQLSASKYNKYF